MKRIDVALKMRETGAIPLYYNPDLEVMKKVISASVSYTHLTLPTSDLV